MTGPAWMERLDGGLDKPLFAEGAGRALLDLPYRRPGADHGADVAALLSAARRRLTTPFPDAKAVS